MGRYTKAYSEFAGGLVEVNTLWRLAASREKDDAMRHGREIDALCRGSIVLLSGRLEGYIRGVTQVALEEMYEKSVPRTDVPVRLYYYISRDIIKRIMDATEPDRIGRGIFKFIDDELPYWSREGAFPQPIDTEKYGRGFANPKFERVKKYFGRLGYDDYHTDLQTKLRGAFMPTITAVDLLVDTRNKIAHGDLEQKRTAGEVAEAIRMTRDFCAATDGVFGAWWRQKFCSIR